MKGTYSQLLRALEPLGDKISKGGQIAYNCPRCERELGNKKDKYNLEINFQKGKGHCWACGLSNLHHIISTYGYKEFADLFKVDTKKDEEKQNIDISHSLSLPGDLSSVYNFPEVLNYLTNERGLTRETIREKNIKYCTNGYFKNNIIFPSYNNSNKLTAFVSHNFFTKKYRKHLSSDFICFNEKFINKNSLIVLTEGVYDGYVVPNSLILLGTEISEKILDFLSETDVLLVLDSDVNKELIEKKVKQLKSVCKSVQVLYLTERQHDLNYFFVKGNELLKKTLLPFFKLQPVL